MTESSPSPAFIPIKAFNERYQFIRKHKDALLGECALYKDKSAKRTVVVHDQAIKTDKDLQKETRCCNFMHILNQCPYMIEFYGYTHKPTPHHGPETTNLKTIREYVECDLERDIATRLRDKDVYCEEDIWRIAQQVISAFAALQSHRVSHGHVSLKTILLQKDENLRAKLQWSPSQRSTFSQVMSQIIPLTSKCLLAPELLEAIKRKNKNFSYNTLLADVFALGLVILSLCTLGDIDDIYNLKDKIISVHQLKSKLHWVRSIYSDRVFFLLSKMLKLDPSKRSDFQCLEDIMILVSKSGDGHEETGSPNKKRIGRSNSPGSPGFRNTSFGRRTINMSTAFENQKMNVNGIKRWPSVSVYSPLSGRNTVVSNGYLSQDSPTASPKKLASAVSAKLLGQRAESTFTSIFDKKASPLVKLGYVDNDNLMDELEKRLLQDPITKILKTGMVIKYYSDGSRYEGQTKGKIREGVGITYYSNGDVYAGEWKKDKFHGRGAYLFDNGERYEGMLLNGLKNGQGVFYYGNKSKYVGDWKNDKKHGKGTFHYFDSKEKYEGDWEDGERHGEGTFTFASGDVYVGTWFKDQKAGTGVLTLSNGSRYEGEWTDNKPHGAGVMIYANEDRYEGNWENGVKSGDGVYFYEDGSKYEGEWADDEKNGQGVLSHQQGDRYVGGWKDGLKQGYGTYSYRDGSVYEGEWSNDHKHGSGSIVLPDGTTYQGEWAVGRRSGRGQLRLINGEIYEGDFKNDKMHGFGIYQWVNGDVFEGHWLNNMMHGSGKYFKNNSDFFSGIWDSQRLVKVTVVDDDE